MNSIFQDLMSSINKASENLSQAERARDRFLEPILEALGATVGSIAYCCVDGENLEITRTGSLRGYLWDKDYSFPLAIFTCEDPLTAAAEYATTKKKAKEDEDRESELAAIKTLEGEIGLR